MIIAITFDINQQRSFDVSVLLLFLCLAFLCWWNEDLAKSDNNNKRFVLLLLPSYHPSIMFCIRQYLAGYIKRWKDNWTHATNGTSVASWREQRCLINIINSNNSKDEHVPPFYFDLCIENAKYFFSWKGKGGKQQQRRD